MSNTVGENRWKIYVVIGETETPPDNNSATFIPNHKDSVALVQGNNIGKVILTIGCTLDNLDPELRNALEVSTLAVRLLLSQVCNRSIHFCEFAESCSPINGD